MTSTLFKRTLLLVAVAIVIGGYFALRSDPHPTGASDALHSGTGEISGIYPSEKSITIRHDPMPTLNMGAMTMPFDVEDARLLDGLTPKQRVEFQVKQVGSDFVITAIKPVK